MKDLLFSQIALCLPSPETKTLFISLKTIIRATVHPVSTNKYDFTLISKKNQNTLHVAIRPGLREFLQAAKKSRYEIVTFSKMKDDILDILNMIDPTKQIFTHRIYHNYCVDQAGKEMPDLDLTLTGRMMHKCVIINQNSNLNVKPWHNTIKLDAFTGKSDDKELWGLIRLFEIERNFEDIRNLLHVCTEEFRLPGLPLPPTTRKTLFLDMDETLIYGRLPLYDKPPERYDFATEFSYVIKRPGVDELLKVATDHDYEIVIYTAAGQIYASPVIDRLDPNGLIRHRLYMESCKRDKYGDPIKDLSLTGRNLDKCVIVDDNWRRVRQRENVIRIKPFRGDMDDTELRKLLQYFLIEEKFENLQDAVFHVNVQFMI